MIRPNARFVAASPVPALTAIAAGHAPPEAHGAPAPIADTHPAPGGDEFAAEKNPFRAELKLWFWLLGLDGDVGGFGVASDLTWSATAVIGYDFSLFNCPASGMLGYRAISWDFVDGSGAEEFTWDVVEHGGILGLSLRF